MRSGKRSVRLKIFLLLVAPLISVIGLWAFAASVTIGDARTQLRTNTIANNLSLPIAAAQGNLGPEALVSVIAMGTHAAADRKTLAEQRARTDGAIGLLRNAIGSKKVRDATTPALRQEIGKLITDGLPQLAALRNSVDAGTVSRLAVIRAYGAFVDQAVQLQEDLGVVTLVDVSLFHQALPLYLTGAGTELINREQAIVLGAFAAGARSLDPDETAAFAQYAYNRRLILENEVAARAPAELGTGLQAIVQSAEYKNLAAIENQIIAVPPGSPLQVDPKTFKGAGDTIKASYSAIARPLGLGLADRAAKAGRPVLIRLGLAGGLGLLAVVLSVLLSVRFGRGITRELTGLQDAARDLADRRLPRIMERLRNDEPVDIDVEAPPLEIGETAEVARVGQAFTTVQRTAIEAAIGQANLRRGVRQVFLNLARRSQSLLHRQLTMLDSMERKTNDPDALEELFRLDHLTTRMRRHAEGLIILSGALPARAWSTPVRVVDVVRAAIAEVESYTRVRVYVLSEASLQGAAVADVTHLVAELVENAASFSPPHTQVQVRAEAVSNGFVVEIEDAGLGMSAEQLAEVNDRLARPPDFDLADTDRLGLFVVAQLAARHSIRVTLRSSPYGGTTAIILMPAELIAQESLAGSANPADRWTRTPGRGGPGGVPGADLDGQLDAIVDVGPDTPALTGRHRRIAGFLQRTRELQGPPAPRQSPEAPNNGRNGRNGHDSGPDNGRGNGRGAGGAGPGSDAGRDPRWAHRSDTGPGHPGPDAGPGLSRDTGQGRDAGQGPGPDAGPAPSRDAGRGAGHGISRNPGRDAGRADAGRDPSQEQGWPSRPEPPGQPPSQQPLRPGQRDASRAFRQDPGQRPAGDGGGRDWDGTKFDLWAPTESAGTSAGTHAGLPRRVRRASLAPQLRDAPAPGSDDIDQNTDTLRSPEQARALMTSLQHGWRRGRSESDQAARPTEETR
jgi:signal transduction histidine kinase